MGGYGGPYMVANAVCTDSVGMSTGQSNGSGLCRKSVNCWLIKNVRPNNRFAIHNSDWPFGYKPIGQSIRGFMEQNNIKAIPGMY